MLIPSLALLIGILFACATFMLLRRGEIRLILGLALLSHGVNLLIFSTGKWQRGLPPILDKDNLPASFEAYANPLPQALILTAIVISFGILAFVVVLINRRFELEAGTPEPVMISADGEEVFSRVPDYYETGMDQTADDYVWLEDTRRTPYRLLPSEIDDRPVPSPHQDGTEQTPTTTRPERGSWS